MTKRKPKRQRLRNPVTIWHRLMASPDKPIPIDDRIRIASDTRDAFERVRTGTATTGDWQCIADCVNMTETIVLFLRWADDETGVLREAATAMVQAHRRVTSGQRALLTGPGLQAVGAVVNSYLQILNQLSERQLVDAEYVTAERYKLLLQGKKFSKVFDETTSAETV